MDIVTVAHHRKTKNKKNKTKKKKVTNAIDQLAAHLSTYPSERRLRGGTL